MDGAGTSTANIAATESELAAVDDMFKRGIDCLNVRVYIRNEIKRNELPTMFSENTALCSWLQLNDFESAVQLFADVLQTRTRHYGGKRFW